MSALRANGHEVDNPGTDATAPVDSPDFAETVRLRVVSIECPLHPSWR